MSLWKQWSFWRTGFNRRMCRVQNAILGAGVQLWRKTQGLIQKPAGAPPLWLSSPWSSTAQLEIQFQCHSSVVAYYEAPEIAQHLLSQAAALLEGSITLSPLELGEVWKVLSVLSVWMWPLYACFWLVSLERVSLLCSVFLCYSSVVTVAASDGLGLRIYLWALWHWSRCNRDSNISWGWRILTLFYAALPTERLALELSYGLLFFSDIGILLKSPCPGRKLTGRKEKAEHLKGLFNCQNLLWTFYIMGFANYWLLVTNL